MAKQKTWNGHRLPDPGARVRAILSAVKTALSLVPEASGPSKLYGRVRRRAPVPIVLMSSTGLFLDRVARQQSPSPLHRYRQNKTLDGSEERIYHRTVTASFPSCLTEGVHPTGLRQVNTPHLRHSQSKRHWVDNQALEDSREVVNPLHPKFEAFHRDSMASSAHKPLLCNWRQSL